MGRGRSGLSRRRGKITRRAPAGAPPGTMIADPSAPRPSITVMAYGPDSFVERKIGRVEELAEFLGAEGRARPHPLVWIDVVGLGDAQVISGIGQMLNLHRLALEDVINVHQRAKLDTYPGVMFFVARMLEPAAAPGEGIGTDQLSLFIGKDFVLTFQERPGDSFGPVRQRLRENAGRARRSGADYLAYSLIDAAIDAYFPMLEGLGEELELLEDRMIADQNHGSVRNLHRIKRDLLTVRRAVWPLRDALSVLYREHSPLVSDETRLFLRDCYDHTVQIIDLVETCREIGSDLMDVHLSQVNNRINEAMRLLAVIATIFIPLSFIASVYGMNFEREASPYNMPELGWRFGYPAVLLLMGTVGGGMAVWFWRRGWIGISARGTRGTGSGGKGSER